MTKVDVERLDLAACPGEWTDATAYPISAGDRRVLLSGSPPHVPLRVVSEPNWQLAAALVNAYRQGLLGWTTDA